jgi:hypothetical protein
LEVVAVRPEFARHFKFMSLMREALHLMWGLPGLEIINPLSVSKTQMPVQRRLPLSANNPRPAFLLSPRKEISQEPRAPNSIELSEVTWKLCFWRNLSHPLPMLKPGRSKLRHENPLQIDIRQS